MADFFLPPIPLWLFWTLAFFTVTGFGFALRVYLMSRFGYPRPVVEFSVTPVNHLHYLMCKIFNRPVTSGKWHWLGIKTGGIEDLRVSVGIRLVVTQRPIVIHRWGAATDGYVTTLPASRHAAEIYLVEINPANGAAIELITPRTAILPGDYILDINIEVDGHHIGPHEKRFKLYNVAPYGEWLN